MSQRLIRKKRIKIFGTKDMPRMAVYRSLNCIYVQLINDEKSQTLVSASSKEIKSGENKIDLAKKVGELIAEKAKNKKISKVVFDRAGFAYHGQIMALAEGARSKGLKF